MKKTIQILFDTMVRIAISLWNVVRCETFIVARKASLWLSNVRVVPMHVKQGLACTIMRSFQEVGYILRLEATICTQP